LLLKYLFFIFRELLNQLREYGFQITSALPLQFIVGNIIRRILNIVREEYTAARKVISSYILFILNKYHSVNNKFEICIL